MEFIKNNYIINQDPLSSDMQYTLRCSTEVSNIRRYSEIIVLV